MSTRCFKITTQRWLFLWCLLLPGMLPVAAQAQITVSGVVTSDDDGEGLPGVSVIIKGTNDGTITDVTGRYQIQAPANGTLVFSFVGYRAQEVVVGNQTTIDISLKVDLRALEEVVIVGYGSMERSNVTGAISSISAQEIKKAPVPNLIESMRGQIPGLRMTRTTGTPGSGVNVLVRGKNSLNSSNDPLIVLDGVPLQGGNLAEIATADIDNINVLKDAAAASIYGTRGANGVILVTTKNGKPGKFEVNATFSQGVTTLAQTPTLFDAEGYVQLKMDAAEGAGQPSGIDDVLTDAIERANYDAGKEVDWHDVLLEPGKQTMIGLSMSGGSDKLTLYMSGDAYLEDGVAIKTNYNRYSFRVNSEYTPWDFVKFGARLQLTVSNADETGGLTNPQSGDNALFLNFINNTPLGSIYNDQGQLIPTIKADQFAYNPLWKYQESEADREITRTLVQPYVEIQIIKGLKYTLNAFVQRRTERESLFRSSKYNLSTLADVPGNNGAQIVHAESFSTLLDNVLSFDKTIAPKHSIQATLIYGFQQYKLDQLGLRNQGTGTDLISYNSIGIQTDFMVTGLNTDENNILYQAGRLSYSYDDRYILTGTLRRDGSSRFGPNEKWGIFPSVSAAWNIHKEPFLPQTEIINVLKLRASYGRLGNDQIGTYRYASLTQTILYPFNNTLFNGQIPGNLPNPNLKWEESRQANIGLDFTLLSSKIFGSMDLYKINTVDLLLNQQISAISGDANIPPNILSNIGETENYGFESIVTYDVLQGGDFEWEVSANWAFDRNKIVRLNNPDSAGNQVDNPTNNWFIGQDIDVVYNYDFVGIYQEGEEDIAADLHPTIFGYGPGDPKIRDVTGDGVITFADQTFLGTATPKWYGGIKNTFKYKGLELTVLFEAVNGVTRVNFFYDGALTGRANAMEVDYWTPDNPSNEFPQPNVSAGYRYADAVRVRDASFVALRNVSLTYTIPERLSRLAKMESAKFYIKGNNLKYFSDFEGYSPETNFGAFPVTKVWTIGTTLTF